VKRAALSAGALGCTLSGSGPSVFALSSSIDKAQAIGTAMHDLWLKTYELESDVFVSKINTEGPKIL